MAHGCLTIIGRFGASIEESGGGLDIVCLWRDEDDLAVHIRTDACFGAGQSSLASCMLYLAIPLRDFIAGLTDR